MSRRLRTQAAVVLGLTGVGMGLLWAYFLSSFATDELSFIQTDFVFPSLVGCLIGLVGVGIYPWARRIGGTFLLVGGIVAPISLFIATGGTVANPGFVLVGIIFAPGLLAAFLLFLAGLLSFQKTRRILRILHDGGWIP